MAVAGTMMVGAVAATYVALVIIRYRIHYSIYLSLLSFCHNIICNFFLFENFQSHTINWNCVEKLSIHVKIVGIVT